MKQNIEVILDTTPNEGCGCNCGCAGSTVVEDMNKLVDNLKEHTFKSELNVDILPISDFESEALISKMNILLGNTKAKFRVNEENIEETLSHMLPLVVLDDEILTAYGVPTLNDVIMEVEKSI